MMQRWMLAAAKDFKRNKEDGSLCIRNALAPKNLDVSSAESGPNLLGWSQVFPEDCHVYTFRPSDCNINFDQNWEIAWSTCKKYLCCHNYGSSCVGGNRNPTFPVKEVELPDAGVQSTGK